VREENHASASVPSVGEVSSGKSLWSQAGASFWNKWVSQQPSRRGSGEPEHGLCTVGWYPRVRQPWQCVSAGGSYESSRNPVV